MSKAFTKEDDSQDDEQLEAPPRPAFTGRLSYITPQGFRKLQSELEYLWKEERPKVTNEVAAAAAQGDRSENAEYIYGKKRLREIDRRIRFLTKRLDEVKVATEPPKQKDKVFFGAWIRLEDEEGKEVTYRIVGSDEFDVKAGAISVESPLARALLGKQVGDCVTVQRPKGDAEFVVTGIRYEEG